MANFTPFEPEDSGRRTNPYGSDIIVPVGAHSDAKRPVIPIQSGH